MVAALLRVMVLTLSLTVSVLLAHRGSPSRDPDRHRSVRGTGRGRAALHRGAAANPTASTVSLTPGLTGFDNIGADSAAQLSCLSDAGYSFDVIDALGAGWDTEYRRPPALGMSIVLFQGFYQPYWSDPARARPRGQLMVTNAQSVGYPRGAQVFLNLENNLTDGTSPDDKGRDDLLGPELGIGGPQRRLSSPGSTSASRRLLTTADLENCRR